MEWIPPLDGDISVNSSHSLKLSWDLPSSWRHADKSPAVAIDGEGTDVVGYQVLYAPSSSWDQPSSRVAVNTKEREFLLNNLEIDACYTLRVSAVFESFSNTKPKQSLFFTNRPVPMQVGVVVDLLPSNSNLLRLSSRLMLFQTQRFSTSMQRLTTFNTSLSMTEVRRFQIFICLMFF